MTKATVYSIDDDKNLQTVVGQYLEDDGYKVVSAYSAQEVIEGIMNVGADVILLDLVLPDMGGLTLLSKIREKTRVPIIIVSGKSDTTEKVVGLEVGADDYITKPFELRELSARIKAVLRRAEGEKQVKAAPVPTTSNQNEKVYRFNGWRLDCLQFELFDDKNQSAGLTTGEFRLLEAMVTSPNRVLSRDYLFELTREGEFESFDRAIDVQIGRLRKKLGDDPKTPAIIKTVRGIGYMFCATVESV
jgi:two-component system, OmpR family, response regulator